MEGHDLKSEKKRNTKLIDIISHTMHIATITSDINTRQILQVVKDAKHIKRNVTKVIKNCQNMEELLTLKMEQITEFQKNKETNAETQDI